MWNLGNFLQLALPDLQYTHATPQLNDRRNVSIRQLEHHNRMSLRLHVAAQKLHFFVALAPIVSSQTQVFSVLACDENRMIC